MNKKQFILAPIFVLVASSVLISQEKPKGTKIWEDERISITVDKVERADSFPERLRDPNYKYYPPEKGNDFVLIHIRVVEKKDLKVDPMELFYAPPNCPHMIDDKGKTHWANSAKYSLPIGMSTLFGEGGYIVFQMPKEATPVQLKFVYPYREEPPESKEKKYGQLDIDLSHIQ
jgi:hypothetical protein